MKNLLYAISESYEETGELKQMKCNIFWIESVRRALQIVFCDNMMIREDVIEK